MIVEEVVLQAIAEKVVGYAWDKVEDRVQKKLGLDPVRQAFNHALRESFEHFNVCHPEWAASLFDISFFEHEGAPLLAQFLIRDGQLDPSKLAASWANSLNSLPERRATYIRDVEPVAADFL